MRKLLFAAALAAAAGVALANNCPNEVKAIDAKLSGETKLSDADKAKVKELRDEGDKLHKEGKHADSMKKLGEAKKMLGI